MWKVLLGVVDVSAEAYIRLISRGPSERHGLILTDIKYDATYASFIAGIGLTLPQPHSLSLLTYFNLDSNVVAFASFRLITR